jgi:hypothetical protein
MRSLNFFSHVKIKWCLVFIILSACVEQIDFDVPSAEFQTVVEGMISDGPGPYTVKISKGISLDADSVYRLPMSDAKVKLYDDEGNVEDFKEANPGEYKTSRFIQGRIGHAYHIVIETEDGKIFESEPDHLKPVGEIENIRYEFEARTIVKPYGEVEANVFNIFVDANGGVGDDNFVRWVFTGTYKVVTTPELHETWNPPYTPYKNPPPCSGYRLIGGPIGSGGLLEQFGDCTCCTCWANHFESIPQLSDVQLVSNNQFKNIKVGEVPVNSVTFYDKYMIEVEQMSLTRKAFDFFRLVRVQKEAAASLFQPPSGEIKGNINSVNSNQSVVGFFWSSSVKKKTIFIHRSDVPYPITPLPIVKEPCTVYRNSSTIKPANWDE